MAAWPGERGHRQEKALEMRLAGAGAPGPSRRQQVLDAVTPARGDVVMAAGILCGPGWRSSWARSYSLGSSVAVGRYYSLIHANLKATK